MLFFFGKSHTEIIVNVLTGSELGINGNNIKIVWLLRAIPQKVPFYPICM